MVIRATPDRTVVDFIDPAIMSDRAANPDMQSIATEVAGKLKVALAAIES